MSIWILFVRFERWTQEMSRSYSLSEYSVYVRMRTRWTCRESSRPKGTDRNRHHSGHIQQKGGREERQLSESERERKRETERSRCIDRRHKIHFMTWTLSSDWCISRRIASQIKRSSTLEPPLTTSPGPHRRRTVPSTLVCISHSLLSFSISFSLLSLSIYNISLSIYMPLPPLHDTRQVYRQKLTSQSSSWSHSSWHWSLRIYGPVTSEEPLDYVPAHSMSV